jgi:uncharacterized protein DUF6249
MVTIFIGMFVFMAVATVAGIVSEYKKRQMELEPLRAAIERGQQLDPAIIERLMARAPHETEDINPVHLRVGGIICIASGIGLALLSLTLQVALPRWMLPLVGLGALTVCVGIGLLVSARVVERSRPHA